MIVDGWRETEQAIDAGLKLRGLFLPDGFDDDAEKVARVLAATSDIGGPQLVAQSVMEKICFGQSPRGVVAEFDAPGQSLEQIQLPETPLILVLDQIEKPGNIGAVFRSADAAAVDAVILCDEGATDVFNPNAIRSSLGAVFQVPSASGSVKQIEDFLVRRGIRALASRVESSSSLWSSDLTGPLAIILGSEADGLGDRWQSLGDRPIPGIKIPMAGRIDSLNVSVSAAVIVFEARRVRDPH